MKFQITKNIGKTAVVFTDDCTDLKDFFKKASAFRELPTVCHHCQGNDLFVGHRVAKGFDYYEVICESLKCGWRLKYGQKKEDGSLFPKEWEPPYSKNDVPQGGSTEGWR